MYIKIWNNIYKIMDEQNLSARKLGRLAKLDHATITKVGNGEVLPNQLTIIKISKGLNRKAEEVFDFSWKDKNI